MITPAVYPRLVEFLHFDLLQLLAVFFVTGIPGQNGERTTRIQSTGQKSHCINTTFWLMRLDFVTVSAAAAAAAAIVVVGYHFVSLYPVPPPLSSLALLCDVACRLQSVFF